jgi:hypothetical protein
MKTIVASSLLLLAVAIALVSCKKDDPASAQANVSFTIGHQPGQGGGVMFIGKPNVDVRVTALVAAFPAQNFRENIAIRDPNQVFSTANWYELGEFTGVTSGQQWTFSFTGSVANGGAPYTANASYTVP